MSKPAATGAVDRAHAVRAALRRLVARNGFHGASMGAVAKEAGVATGTAYVHYASKDDLVIAAYVETKRALGAAATADVVPGSDPADRFRAIWLGIHAHLSERVDDARFLVQVEHSPYAGPAHEAALAAGDDEIVAAASAPDMVALLAPLPLDVLWDLGLAPAVRLASSGTTLTPAEVEATVHACWRAITT